MAQKDSCDPRHHAPFSGNEDGMTGRFAAIALAAALLAGCGDNKQQQSSPQGTDGQGRPLQSCYVTFTYHGCAGEETTIQVDGTEVALPPNTTILSPSGC
jgi:hypothetical protein